MKFVLALFLLFTFSNNSFTQEHREYFPDPDTAIQHRLEEWKDLKFGLLMHWGTYSQWGIVESWSICPEDLGWASAARKKGIAEENYSEFACHRRSGHPECPRRPDRMVLPPFARPPECHHQFAHAQ